MSKRQSERFLEEHVNRAMRFVRESRAEHAYPLAFGIVCEAVRIHLANGLSGGPSEDLFEPPALRKFPPAAPEER